MIKVSVFLASSIDELAQERSVFGDFIRQSNDILNPLGVEIRLLKCEDLDDKISGDKQKLLDDMIRQSDYFVVLFKNRYGKVTIHEYDVASRAFEDTEKPSIIPYFYSSDKRDVDLDSMDQSLKDLVEKYRETNHYYRVFNEIEMVELRFLTQIMRDLRNTHHVSFDTIDIGRKMNLDREKLREELIVSGDKAYIDFAARVIERMYHVSEMPYGHFVSYGGQVFPDTFVVAADECRGFNPDEMEFDFFKKCTLRNIKPRRFNEEDYRLQEKRYIAGTEKVDVDLYGYMVDTIQINEAGEFVSMDFLPGTYYQNAVSTLTLREEFENIFKSVPDENAEVVIGEDTWRHKLHQAIDNDFTFPKLFSGIARYNQPGIQVIILFKNPTPDRAYRKYRNAYWTPIIKRKNNVYEQPGFYLFTPVGRFQIFESKEMGSDTSIQKERFDLIDYIMYLIARELFNDAEDQSAFGQSELDIPVKNKINHNKGIKNKHCQEILDLLEQKKATFEFLGLSSSYIALKSDLVFMLKIDDEEYYNRNADDFCFAFESKSLSVLPLPVINEETYFENPCLTQEITPCLELLRHSRYKDEIFSV